MQQVDAGFLPVLDELTGKLVGVVTDRDLCMVMAVGRDPVRVQVHDCMTANPVCCYPDDDVRVALALMQSRQIRRVLVVDTGGRLQGVVSISDVLRCAELAPKEICDALKTICQPRGITQLGRSRAAVAS